jgi:hypothetical protein
MTIEIHKPLENIKIKGKHVKAVGIPDWRLSQESDPVIFSIQYEYKSAGLAQGKKQFPHKYKIAKADIKQCTRGQVGNGEGYIVPIEKMTEIETFSYRQGGVMTATCRYCKDKFEYYTREDDHINCLKPECIKKAVADGIYKDFKGG